MHYSNKRMISNYSFKRILLFEVPILQWITALVFITQLHKNMLYIKKKKVKRRKRRICHFYMIVRNIFKQRYAKILKG